MKGPHIKVVSQPQPYGWQLFFEPDTGGKRKKNKQKNKKKQMKKNRQQLLTATESLDMPKKTGQQDLRVCLANSPLTWPDESHPGTWHRRSSTGGCSSCDSQPTRLFFTLPAAAPPALDPVTNAFLVGNSFEPGFFFPWATWSFALASGTKVNGNGNE